MQRDAVELVRAIYALGLSPEAIERAFDEYLTEEFEVRMPAIYPDAGTFRGREGILRWRATTADAWGDWRFEPECYEQRDDRVLVLVRLVAEGSASGVELQREVAHVWTLRGGRATAVEIHLDRGEALASLGIEAS